MFNFNQLYQLFTRWLKFSTIEQCVIRHARLNTVTLHPSAYLSFADAKAFTDLACSKMFSFIQGFKFVKSRFHGALSILSLFILYTFRKALVNERMIVL